MTQRNIVLASDHAGFELKEKMKLFLSEYGNFVNDLGALKYDAADDYPAYIAKAAHSVAADSDHNTVAIVFGRSGQGEAMVANRFKGVRAVVWYGKDKDIIKLSREHNDSNVLSIGAHFVSEEEAKRAIMEWLGTNFSGDERHSRRIKQIDEVK